MKLLGSTKMRMGACGGAGVEGGEGVDAVALAGLGVEADVVAEAGAAAAR